MIGMQVVLLGGGIPLPRRATPAAHPGEIVEFGNDALEVANAVSVAVFEATRVNLVDNSLLPPERLIWLSIVLHSISFYDVGGCGRGLMHQVVNWCVIQFKDTILIGLLWISVKGWGGIRLWRFERIAVLCRQGSACGVIGMPPP